MARPDVSGGKARQIYALVARGARAGVRGATLGREPSPCTIGIRRELKIIKRPGGPEPALGSVKMNTTRSDTTSKWKHPDVPGTSGVYPVKKDKVIHHVAGKVPT